MRFSILSDANQESGLDEVFKDLSENGFRKYFEPKFYDDSGINVTVILMCRDPSLDFKQRIRFSRKENKLYMDLMLDLNIMAPADLSTRKLIVGEKIVNEVPQIVAKKKFKDFDLPRFSRDLREWFEQHGWIEPMFADDEIY